MKSLLKPDTSIIVGVSTAALVGFTYQFGLPNLSTIGATGAQDLNIESGRKRAAWTGAIMVAGLSLLTRDRTVFVIGGLTLIMLDVHARHANAVAPDQTSVVTTQYGYAPAQESQDDQVGEPPPADYAYGGF